MVNILRKLMTQDDFSPVYGYLQNPSMVDFAGKLAAVFFTTGCNFRCGFCHNASLMGQSRPGMSWHKLEEGCRRFVNDWVDGAVITGGEPTLSGNLETLIGFLKQFGWAVKLDTNGSRPDVLKSCMPLVDYVAMDIKTGLSGYSDLTGFKNISRIKESVELIKKSAPDYEFRTTIIEGIHTDAEMQEAADLIRGAKRYIVQPFIPSESLPDIGFRKLKRTRAGRMEEIAELVADCADEVLVRGS